MSTAGDREALVRAYALHPVRAETLIQRLAKRNPELEDLTETDLALDPEGVVTDQNHVGGLQYVRDLIDYAEIREDEAVLDVGSGIGGAARALAELTGCAVLGVDLSPERHADAVRLTRMVGLQDRVLYRCGDFFEVKLEPESFDVIVAQSSIIHFADPRAVVERCRSLLKPDGRLVVEDCHLAMSPGDDGQKTLLDELERVWLVKLSPVETWIDLCDEHFTEVRWQQDLDDGLVQWFEKLLAHSMNPPPDERRGWELALALAREGVVGYFRLLAQR